MSAAKIRVENMTRVAEAITRAQANSPFLAGLMDRNPELMAMIEAGEFDAALAQSLARTADNVGTALRQDRKSTRLNSSHRSLSRMPSSA